ncbi:VWA domain-containing protein, partial [Couchioplanes caeruleus]|uniref:VWA domain-containing protein n=1 Tax=Couchioplanes caeruleus TaxID=56438 RepID=UPI000AC8E797
HRRRAGGGAALLPVRLQPEDFEVAETERRASAVVALCVDLSYSMFADGRWGPMKQTALALSHLVATRFPQDSLQIVGFGRHAMPLSQGELAAVEPDLVQGTNLQHALKLAGRHLRRHPGAEPVVLVVTDGEPTAHLEADGEAFFTWPTDPETVRLTVREVDQLTRYGATLNLFMLGEEPGLRRFVDAVAQRSGGRVFSPDVGELGRYVVDDYVRSRRGRR